MNKRQKKKQLKIRKKYNNTIFDKLPDIHKNFYLGKYPTVSYGGIRQGAAHYRKDIKEFEELLKVTKNVTIDKNCQKT